MSTPRLSDRAVVTAARQQGYWFRRDVEDGRGWWYICSLRGDMIERGTMRRATKSEAIEHYRQSLEDES